MKKLTITELSRGLSDYVNRATYRGEEFLILRGGKPVAALSPVASGVRVADLVDVFESLPSIPSDDLECFAKAISEAREFGNDALVDRWPSS